eukprot:scaffold2419_cov260-Chaetoceros_neogracile.AAC.1
MERLELKLKQKVLKRWRYVVIIQMHIRQRQHYQLEQLITTWKRYSEESILKWKLAIRSAESLSDEISFKRIGRVFDFMYGIIANYLRPFSESMLPKLDKLVVHT